MTYGHNSDSNGGESTPKAQSGLNILSVPPADEDDNDSVDDPESTSSPPVTSSHHSHSHSHSHHHPAPTDNDDSSASISSSSSSSSSSSTFSSSYVFQRCQKVDPVFRYHAPPANYGHIHDPSEFAQYEKCKQWKDEYHINPGHEWGKAPPDIQTQWGQSKCDEVFIEAQHHTSDFKGRAGNHETMAVDIDVHHKPAGSQWIGILTPMTTSHSDPPIKSIYEIPFWTDLFPSFIDKTESLHDNADPFYFTFFIGYDLGDKFLDNKENLILMVKEMYKRLDAANVCRHKVGVRFYSMADTVHAPSWGVTHLAHSAYDIGVDWFYQINDDVQIRTTKWEKILTEVMATTCNVGVTGPKDVSNERIFTQSFSHRTHIDIFGYYFAMPFQNWWSDDWISSVYPPQLVHPATGPRSHGVVVKHEARVMRYPVKEAQHLLDSEVAAGRQTLKQWLIDTKNKHECSSGKPDDCICRLASI